LLVPIFLAGFGLLLGDKIIVAVKSGGVITAHLKEIALYAGGPIISLVPAIKIRKKEADGGPYNIRHPS
jgi:hypothetical protein